MSQAEIREVIASRDVAAFRAGLPQGSQIREADALAWMEDQAESTDFHEPGWHYNRLKGIGGSEAAYAVQQGRILDGLVPDIPSKMPRGLFLEKLLRIPPEPTEAVMLRGNRSESLIVDRLLEQTGAKPRQDLMDAVAEVSGQVKSHPWMVGNPDLIVESRKGRIILIDAKAPSQPAGSVDPAYVAQLHHYRRLMLEAGVPPDMLMLGSFNWPEYRVDLMPVDFDERLDGQLRQGGDALWQAILDGEAPDQSQIAWPKPAWDTLSEDEREHKLAAIQAEEAEYLQAKMAAEKAIAAAKEKADRLGESLSSLGPVRGCKPADYGMALAGVSTTVKVDETRFADMMRRFEKDKHVDKAYRTGKNFDADRMAARLEELGEDLEEYRERRIDPAKAIELLEENGVPYARMIGDVVEERPSIRLTPPKKGPKKESYDALKATTDTQWAQWQALTDSAEEAVDPAKAEPAEDKRENEAETPADPVSASPGFTTTFSQSLKGLATQDESLISDVEDWGDMNPDSTSPSGPANQVATSEDMPSEDEAKDRPSASVLGLFGPG